MITASIVLLISIAILGLVSKRIVDYALKIASYFGAEESAIGLIFIAIFTSIPELFIGVFSASEGHPGISLGNVVGSNIADILLVLGAGVLLATSVKINQEKIKSQIGILFIFSLIPILLLLKGLVSWIDGIILILLFIAYCIFILRQRFSKLPRKDFSAKEWIWININFWFGLAAVVISAYYAVESAIEIASIIGVPDWLIAISAIALGTSLPELAVDVSAIRKGHVDLAIGDILGSCMANITLVFGVTLLLSPTGISVSEYTFPILALIGTNLLLWYLTMKRSALKKIDGLMMVMLYIFFIIVTMLLGIT